MLQIRITDMVPLIAFWLIFTRWLTVLMFIPLFDNTAIPVIIKVMSALLISFAFYPDASIPVMRDVVMVGQDNFWYLTVMNGVVALVMGFLVRAILEIFVSAGSIITQQIGLSAIRYFDPVSTTQIGPFELFIQWSMLVIILSGGALYPMFKGMQISFHTIHFGQLGHLQQATPYYIQLFKDIFLSSLSLAMPMIYVNLLIAVILGIVSRTVPQMNVLMVSFALNIGLGLIVFLSTSDEFFQVANSMYLDKLGRWFQFVQ